MIVGHVDGHIIVSRITRQRDLFVKGIGLCVYGPGGQAKDRQGEGKEKLFVHLDCYWAGKLPARVTNDGPCEGPCVKVINESG